MKQLYIKFIVALPILCFFTIQVNAQAEVPNPTFPFWKVNGNSGTNSSTNFIGTTDNVSLRFGTKNIMRMSIDSNGRVGIATTTPATRLDVKGDLALRERVLTLANGINNDVAVDSNTFFRVTGPVSLFALTGLAGGVDGKIVTLFNNTSSTMFIDAMALSLPANQILTGAGDLFVADSGSVTLQYSSTISKWVVNSYNNASYGATAWNLTGNASTTPGTNFMGTIDNQDVMFKRNGFQAGLLGVNNTAWGDRALIANTTGFSNTAIGAYSLTVNQTGAFNVGVGLNALTQNSSGRNNVGVGTGAATSNTTGFSNVAIGIASLFSNTIRSNLVAVGDSALYNNGVGAVLISTQATDNVAVGSKALFANTIGDDNTAVGTKSLTSNTAGTNNTAIGSNAMGVNSSGSFNTAVGSAALIDNTTGFYNTAVGTGALSSNTVGENNSAVGMLALDANTTGSRNTALGEEALLLNTTGSNNLSLGYLSLPFNTTGNSNVAVGVNALYSNTIRSNLVAVGDSALYNNGVGVLSPIDAIQNVAVGSKALFTNTRGTANTAVGFNALRFNSTGTGNTALGSNALISNTLGGGNTALGFRALDANTTGSNNSAVGLEALNANTTGFSNVAVGNSALLSNTTRSNLVAVGDSALYNNGVGVLSIAEGIENTAVGSKAGYANSRGSSNTALGFSALRFNTTGSGNVAVGTYSLEYIIGTNNTAVGFNSGLNHVSNSSSTFIGANADDLVGSLFNVTAIGANAKVSQQNNIIFGDTVNRPKIGIGVTAVGKTLSGTLFEVASEGTNDNLLFRYSGAQTPKLNFQRSNGTLTAPTAVVSGSTLGRLDFYGYEGTIWDQAAFMIVEADSAISTGIVPSRFRFITQNSVGLGERLRITRNGSVVIADGTDRDTKLYVDGGLTIEPLNLVFTLTADNQVVNVEDESYIRLSSNTTVGNTRTVYLGNGREVGQILIISSNSTGTNQFEFVDVNTDPATNTETGVASLLMDSKDTATFIWDGTDWLMLSFRSNN